MAKDNLFYIWADHKDGHGFVPHMTFTRKDREAADFEIQDLKDHGSRAKYGAAFK